MTLRTALQNELRAMSPNAHGRRAFEKMMRRLTNLELAAATGIKIRLRIPAGRKELGRLR